MTQNKPNITKNLSLIAVFASKYFFETEYYSLIASISYRENFYKIPYTDLRDWDKETMFKGQNIKEPFNIISIIKQRDSMKNNILRHKNIDYDLNNTYVNISELKNLDHILILDPPGSFIF